MCRKILQGLIQLVFYRLAHGPMSLQSSEFHKHKLFDCVFNMSEVLRVGCDLNPRVSLHVCPGDPGHAFVRRSVFQLPFSNRPFINVDKAGFLIIDSWCKRHYKTSACYIKFAWNNSYGSAKGQILSFAPGAHPSTSNST